MGVCARAYVCMCVWDCMCVCVCERERERERESKRAMQREGVCLNPPEARKITGLFTLYRGVVKMAARGATS